MLFVKTIQRTNAVVRCRHGGVLQHAPVQLPVKVPFLPLGKLRSHEQQLAPRVRQHVGQKALHARQLHALVPGHLAPQGAFHMHHLVVGDGQHKSLGKGVHHGKGDIPMMIPPEEGVHFQIVAQVVHPAHVPLQVKSQPLGACHMGPGGGLLGDHQGGGLLGVDGAVQKLQKRHSLQIFLAAVSIGAPLGTAVIQIQHGGHGVHPQAVHVILLQPPDGRRQQEAAHLPAAIVKDPGAPALVLPFQAVAVFIEARAVKLDKPVLILAEMRRHPVQKHRHAGLMERVHQIFQILRRSVAGGRGKVPCALVAPGGVQGVLRHGHQLHRRVAHVGHIGRQLVGQLPVVKGAAVGIAAPGTGMHLIDVQRAL